MSIQFNGVHHLALVCKDMQRTVDFYTNKLGMKLKKGFDLGGGYGQHFFFDMGNGSELAFFWFVDAKDAAPGVASANSLVGSDQGSISSAVGSMNHVAFDVPPEKIEAYREELIEKGVDCSQLINHDDVVTGDADRTAAEMTGKTWLRSFYFFDPDNIMLEFCATLAQGSADVESPVNAQGQKADGKPLT